MKKFLAVLLMVALVATLGLGCAPAAPAAPAASAEPAAPAAADAINVGVSIASFDDTFLTYMMDGMKAKAKTLEGVNVTYVDARSDAATQLAQVENFITQGMSSIVVNPVNTEATGPITEACAKAKIPLVYLNRLPANLPDDVTFVGSNSIDAGIFQMEYIGEKLGGKGNVVIMMGVLDHEAAIKRTEGVKKVIAEKYPDIKVIAEQTGNWSRSEGMTLMENWLSKGDKIDAVCANNDDMALGAIGALEAAGKLDTMIVGGVDCTPDAVQALKDGKLSVTVFQDAAGQGGGSLEAAVMKAKGEKVEKEIMIPFVKVTKDNVDEYPNFK